VPMAAIIDAPSARTVVLRAARGRRTVEKRMAREILDCVLRIDFS
jgi:hypothetical protein